MMLMITRNLVSSNVAAQLIAPVSLALARPGDWRNQLRRYIAWLV